MGDNVPFLSGNSPNYDILAIWQKHVWLVQLQFAPFHIHQFTVRAKGLALPPPYRHFWLLCMEMIGAVKKDQQICLCFSKKAIPTFHSCVTYLILIVRNFRNVSNELRLGGWKSKRTVLIIAGFTVCCSWWLFLSYFTISSAPLTIDSPQPSTW